MVLELGLLASAIAADNGPCVRIDREENYADPSTAKSMRIDVYKAKRYDDISKKEALRMLCLEITFDDYSSMIELYNHLGDCID